MAKRPVSGTRPSGSYSPGIVAEGCFVFVSGQGPLREGEIVGHFPQPLPARTTVGTVLPRPGMRVEIDCVAGLPDHQGEQYQK